MSTVPITGTVHLTLDLHVPLPAARPSTPSCVPIPRMRRRSPTAVPHRDPKTGTWRFVVDAGFHETGKRRQLFRRGFPTKADAQAALDEIRLAREATS